MEFNEMAELFSYAAGTGVVLLGLNELRKKYVNWAEKNKFYDPEVKFRDLEKETNYIGKRVEFNGNEIKEI